MASKSLASTSLLLSLNLIFFTLVSSHHYPPPPTMPSPSPPPTTPAPSLPPTTPAPSLPSSYPNLTVCVRLLDDLVTIVIRRPPNRECCSLIPDVLDLQAAVCLYAVIRVHALEILHINIDVALSLILNNCDRTPPPGFQCPRA